MIFDTVGSVPSSFSSTLLRLGANAKYVTIVTPMIRNADKHGLLVGGLKSAVKLGTRFIRVSGNLKASMQKGPLWHGLSPLK